MLLSTVADQHIVAATVATISFQPTDSHGDPADPLSAVTVTVASSNGTAIATDQATVGATDDPRTFALTPAQTATIDRLTATWTADGVVIGTTVHAIIGRPIITSAEYKTREPKRVADFVAADFRWALADTFGMILERANRSFVPMLAVEVTESVGRSSLGLTFPDIESVLWATDDNGTTIDVSTARPSSTQTRVEFPSKCWPSGRVTVAYVHGMKAVPGELVGAVAKRISSLTTSGHGMTPAASLMPAGIGAGGGFRPMAGYGRSVTGDVDVDAAINANKWEQIGMA